MTKKRRTLDFKKLATQARADIAKYENQFTKDPTDTEFMRMIAADVARLTSIAASIEQGDLRSAYKSWSRGDTVVREALSAAVVRALSRGNAIGLTEFDSQ